MDSLKGPLLFLIYIKDLCQVSNILDMIFFADDTNIFYSHKDPNFLNTVVNTELDKLSSWFQASRLSTNVKKSNFVILNQHKTDKILTSRSSLITTKLFVSRKSCS